MDQERVENLKNDYDKTVQRISKLITEYKVSRNVTPNRIFMTNYHYYILKSYHEEMLNLKVADVIFNIEIERLNKTGDVIYCGYVEQG